MTSPVVPRLWRTRATEVCREQTYGVDPGTPGLFPAFPQIGERPTFETTAVGRHPAAAAPGGEESRYVAAWGVLNPLRTVLIESVEPAQSQAWLLLLEAAGFRKANNYRYEADPHADAASLTVRTHLDNQTLAATGVRGSLSLSAEAGSPINLAAKLVGRMRSVDEMPYTPSRARWKGRRWLGARVRIAPETLPPILPMTSAMTIDTGTILAERAPANATESSLEWRVEAVVPSVTLTVEYGPTTDPPYLCNARTSVGVDVGGWRWEFGGAYLSRWEAPQMGPSGIALIPLTFRVASGGSCDVVAVGG